MNKLNLKIIISFLLVFSLCWTFTLATAQESPKYGYEEYSYYTKAQKEKNLAKKEAALFEFLNRYPKSTLMPYVITEFRVYFNQLLKAHKYDNAISSALKLLRYRPGELAAYQALAGAYYSKKDYANYLKYGELIYKKTPSVNLAYFLACAAFDVKKIDKCESYYNVVKAKGSLLMKIDLAFKLYSYYFKDKNNAKTLLYAKQIVSLFENNPKPNNFKGDWRAYKMKILNPCYGYIGSQYIKSKNFLQASEIFKKILNINPHDAASYFWLGLAYWYSGKAKSAAPAFAKAIVLNVQPISGKAEEQLKLLIKKAKVDQSKYDEYIQKAKEELGM